MSRQAIRFGVVLGFAPENNNYVIISDGYMQAPVLCQDSKKIKAGERYTVVEVNGTLMLGQKLVGGDDV